MVEISTIAVLPPVRAIEPFGPPLRGIEPSGESVAARQQPPGQHQQHADQSSLGHSVAQGSRQEAVIELAQRQIHFAVDTETRRTIIKVVDPETNEVVRQIPPEEALRISRMISRLRGDRGAVTDERV
jgi:flagellar protein FlaG